ncbi:MAG: diguanylate cyclase (GGDEF)-like protein [Phenylobacterium sp.]|jgi:diguanylate cyclase (GGDEF)-like protein
MKEQATILVADGDPVSLKSLCSALSQDYRVLFANNGHKAIEIVKREVPDLVILDVLLPDMAGYKVFEQLKNDQLTHDIPTIFLTCIDQEADEQVGLQMGAVDYWTRPFSFGIIRTRVRNHLELKRHRDLLASMALTDPLTGIANRRHFDESLIREWERASRSGKSLTLLLADIDHFKAYNDNYGHCAGDRCLHHVAQAISSSMNRSADFVARYGPEEFVCILPDTDAQGGLTIGEKIRKAVEVAAIVHGYSSVAKHVTISIGMATLFPVKGSSPGKLVIRADEHLYEAKENGRNQVAFAA